MRNFEVIAVHHADKAQMKLDTVRSFDFNMALGLVLNDPASVINMTRIAISQEHGVVKKMLFIQESTETIFIVVMLPE